MDQLFESKPIDKSYLVLKDKLGRWTLDGEGRFLTRYKMKSCFAHATSEKYTYYMNNGHLFIISMEGGFIVLSDVLGNKNYYNVMWE